MAVAKVIYKSSANATPEVWMDATTATAAAEDVIAPKTAMLADGVVTEGTGSGGGDVSFDELATGDFAGDVVLETTTAIRDYAFSTSRITSIDAPLATICKNYAFANCKQLESVNMPLANHSSPTGWFDGCSSLETIHLPKITAFWNYMFRNCTSLITVVCPSITNISRPNSFNGDTALKAVDFGKGTITPNSLGANFFQNNSALGTLILRYNTAAGLSNINCFTGTPFASDGSGGTLYVPKALIDNNAYTTATNWSTILGYANNQIKAIEGSQYENYYADGTAIQSA